MPAQIPVYEPSIPVQDPGAPQARLEPMPPAASGAQVGEAAARLGQTVEQHGSQLAKSIIYFDRLKAQQEDYALKEQYKTSVQNMLMDPKSGLLNNFKGEHADEALYKYDEATKGTAGQPGIRGSAPLRAQFMEGKTALQQKELERSFDAIDSQYRGVVMKHAMEEREAGAKATLDAHVNSQINDGAAVRNISVDSPDGRIPSIKLAEDQLRETFKNNAYFQRQGHPQEVQDHLVQGHVDALVHNAVEANAGKNWQDAQKILDASSASPKAKVEAQNLINGARISQYSDALANQILSNPMFRTAEGQIDEAKAQEYAHDRIAEQQASNGLPPGHEDTLINRLQTQMSVHNKGVSQRQQIVLNKVSNDIWNSQVKGVPPDQAYQKFIVQGQFDNAIERGKAEDIFKKVYEHDPTALDTVAAHWTPEMKDSFKQVEDSPEVDKRFPTSEEKKQFMDAFKQQIIEKQVRNRAGINQLFQDNLKQVPTGRPGWLQEVGVNRFGGETREYHDIVADLQKNQPLIKAVGGTEAAYALSKKLGGAGVLAPDTDTSKAVVALLERGVKPQQIKQESIDAVISKHPDWLK